MVPTHTLSITAGPINILWRYINFPVKNHSTLRPNYINAKKTLSSDESRLASRFIAPCSRRFNPSIAPMNIPFEYRSLCFIGRYGSPQSQPCSLEINKAHHLRGRFQLYILNASLIPVVFLFPVRLIV